MSPRQLGNVVVEEEDIRDVAVLVGPVADDRIGSSSLAEAPSIASPRSSHCSHHPVESLVSSVRPDLRRVLPHSMASFIKHL
eukprot:128126-Heterocapsa_arctica.AAC.1